MIGQTSTLEDETENRERSSMASAVVSIEPRQRLEDELASAEGAQKGSRKNKSPTRRESPASLLRINFEEDRSPVQVLDIPAGLRPSLRALPKSLLAAIIFRAMAMLAPVRCSPTLSFFAPRTGPRASDRGPRRAHAISGASGAAVFAGLAVASRSRARVLKSQEDDVQWVFTGRAWFRPAIQQVKNQPKEVSFVSLLGWSLGGLVCLEYDDSPCGAYREVVDMGSVVVRGGAIGQWGSRLCVSSQEAEDLCRAVWGVPAECRSITFDKGTGTSEGLRCSTSHDAVKVTGWEALRLREAEDTSGLTFSIPGRLPIWWTPTIKSLWLPLRLGENEDGLKLHRIFLSAEKLSLQWHWPGDDTPNTGDAEGVPLPLSILADGLKVEICPEFGKL
eukprot:s2058_g12.t3